MIDIHEYQATGDRCYLELRGDAFRVDDFLQTYDDFPHHLLWRKGDQLSDGFVLQDYGIRVYLTDGPLEEWAQEGELLDFLFDHYIELSSLRTWECAATANLSIYDVIPSKLCREPTLCLAPALMGMLAGLGIQLEISVVLKNKNGPHIAEKEQEPTGFGSP